MWSFTTNLAEIEDALQMKTWFTECFTIDHRSPYLTMMNPSDCCFDLFCRLLGEMVWVDRSALSSFATACYRGESLTEIGCSCLRMWKRLYIYIITVVRGKFHWDQATKLNERKASRKPDWCHTEWLQILEHACLLVCLLVGFSVGQLDTLGLCFARPSFLGLAAHRAVPRSGLERGREAESTLPQGFEDLRRNEERQWCEVFARYCCKASCLSCPLLWLAQNQTQRKWLD